MHARLPGRIGVPDTFETVALVACAKRATLLRVHRHRLSREDLEDCYSQATFELLRGVRAGRVLVSARHIANALEQRLASRIDDRLRAVGGRSPIETALAAALPLGGGAQTEVEPADVRADVEQLVQLRQQLRQVVQAAAHLTGDQRLVLRSQLTEELSPAELCRREEWSVEKYRKLAQRARRRLRGLVECPVRHASVG